MTLHGQFDDTFGNGWEVQISNPSAIAREYIIGQVNEFIDGTVSVYFTDDPINIETEIEDTFATIIKKSCTINLATNVYLGDLLFTGTDDITVNVFKNNECVFAGVVQPQTYSQPYTDVHDVFTLNCVDYLTTLGYHKYKNATAANYNAIKVSSDNVVFGDYIREQLSGFTASGDVLFDDSKKVTSGDTDCILNKVAFNDQIALGDTYDDCLTNEEVLTEMLKYLNLHIIQDGYNFYIFDWGTFKNGRENWVSLLTGNSVFVRQYTLQMAEDIWRSAKTNLTVDKVYSQIKVKCDLEEQGTFITSPLESGDLYNLFGKRIPLSDEIISWGDGQTAREAIWNYCKYGSSGTSYDGLQVRKYYIEVRENRYWTFYIPDTRTVPYTHQSIDVAYDTDANGNYINQYKIPLLLKKKRILPCIFNIGYPEEDKQPEGGEPLGKWTWNDYLYLSVLGNLDDSSNGHRPTSDDIQLNNPMIEYISPNAGGAYSPIDDSTNYLVFSGKMLLQPYAQTTGEYSWIKSLDYPNPLYLHPVEMRDDKGEAYVTRKYYNDNGDWLGEDSLNFVSKELGENKQYQFNYSACGDNTDKFKKLPVLECELVIGNKRLIENKMDIYGNSEFTWVTIGEEPYWMDENGNYILEDGEPVKKTTFSLGFNPNLGDHIIGKEYDIQNTVTISTGIDDAEGTAIPITKEDALAGAVVFRVLGPIVNQWNNITRRHPTFFRSEKFYENYIYVLSHVENIIIKDFECKIYSSTNVLDSNTTINESDDLIYISAENSKSIEDYEQDFKLMTQLTNKEAKDKGLTLQSFTNAVIDVSENLPLSTVYNVITGENAKPEEHYVNAYYQEYHSPKLMLEADVKDFHAEFNSLYYNANLNKTFYVLKCDHEAENGFRHVQLKEV